MLFRKEPPMDEATREKLKVIAMTDKFRRAISILEQLGEADLARDTESRLQVRLAQRRTCIPVAS